MNRSKILELLHENSVDEESFRQDFLNYLMNLTPSELDLQLQNLLDYDNASDRTAVDIHAVEQFFILLEKYLTSRRNFEFIQAIIHRILLVHSTNLIELRPMLDHLVNLQSAQSFSGQSLQNMLHLTLCLTKNLLSIPIS
jgi:hypothetical protein